MLATMTALIHVLGKRMSHVLISAGPSHASMEPIGNVSNANTDCIGPYGVRIGRSTTTCASKSCWMACHSRNVTPNMVSSSLA
jgi:hypothetical protein